MCGLTSMCPGQSPVLGFPKCGTRTPAAIKLGEIFLTKQIAVMLKQDPVS